MYGKGLGINARAVEQVQNYLQGKLTFEVSTLLENLSDSNLTPKVGLSVKPGGYTFSNVVSINTTYASIQMISIFFLKIGDILRQVLEIKF